MNLPFLTMVLLTKIRLMAHFIVVQLSLNKIWNCKKS